MLLEGNFALKSPIEELWGFLLKPETLGSCIPGCEKMEKIDDNTFESIVAAKMGFIVVRLKFTTTLTDLEPPHRIKAVAKGEDLGKHGQFTQNTVVDLKELPEGQVEVSYKSNVSIVGPLATFGDRVMRIKAKQIEKEFTENLKKTLSDQTLPRSS